MGNTPSVAKANTKVTSQAWLAWGIVTFFYAFQYVLRVSPSIMITEIRSKFGVDTEQFGDFSGAYYLGYALMHIPIGLMLDHVGPRKVIAASVLLCSIGMLPLIYGDSWTMAVIGRFILGAGSSTAILGVFKVIRLNFPSQKFGTVLGFSVMIGLLGAIYGGRPIQGFVTSLGWTTVLSAFSISGIILAILIFFIVPTKKVHKEDFAKNDLAGDIKAIVKTPYVLSTAVLAALMVGPLEGFADVWGVSFLVKVYGYDQETAAFLPSLIFFGMCFGAPALAYLGEVTGKYGLIVRLSAFIMGALFIIILASTIPMWGINISFFIIGLLSAYQVLVMHINSMRVDKKYSGVVTSLTNMIIMSFGYVFHKLIGMIMNKNWDGSIIDGVKIYSSDAYINGLIVIPVALFLAFIGFYLERIHARIKK